MRSIAIVLLVLGIAALGRADDATAKAREVDELLGHLGYDDALPRMLVSITRTLQKTYAPLKLPSEVWDEVAKELTYEEARAMSAKLYSEKLTLEEVKAANAFYDSDVGRSYSKKVAEIGKQEFYQARDWSKTKTEAVLKKYLKAKGLLKEPNQSPESTPMAGAAHF